MVKEILTSSRKMRRRRHIKKSVFLLVLLTVLFFIIGGFFYIEEIRIRSIVVNGAETIGEDLILQTANAYLSHKKFMLLPVDNIFLLSKKELKQKLASQFLKIKTIELNKKYPNQLSINIEERKAWALLCKEDGEEVNSCFYIDDEGFIFQNAPVLSGNILTRFVDKRGKYQEFGNFVLSQEDFWKIKYFIDRFKEDLDKRIIKVSLLPENIYELEGLDGWYVVIDDETNEAEAFENILIILNAQIKEKINDLNYIDLRFGNKVYYKID